MCTRYKYNKTPKNDTESTGMILKQLLNNDNQTLKQ